MDKKYGQHRTGNKTFFRTVWLSDIHLGHRDCHADCLLQFLESIECERLYLVGDIVDLLAMKKKMHWPTAHSAVIREIIRLAKTDTRVIYVPGNHDIPLRDLAGDSLLNVEIHRHYIHETLQGKQLLILHGDEFDHAALYNTLIRLIGDYVYEIMLLLNRVSHAYRRMLGLPFWSLAEYLKTNVGRARKAIEAFEAAAIAEVQRRGVDGIVCGHIHKASLREVDGAFYCNDGDWTESCTALVETRRGALKLLQRSDIEDIALQSQSLHIRAA